MNTATTPESIAPQEAELIQNMEFSPHDNALRTAPGQRLLFASDDAITSCYAQDNIYLLTILQDKNQYLYSVSTSFSNPIRIGMLTGTLTPDFALYTDANNNSFIVIASGSNLQLYDPDKNTLEQISDFSADIVFVRSNRVVATLRGSNRINYSAIGNPRSWYTEPQDVTIGAKNVLRHYYKSKLLQTDGSYLYVTTQFVYTYDDDYDEPLPVNFYNLDPEHLPQEEKTYEDILANYYRRDPSIAYNPPEPFSLALVNTVATYEDGTIAYETNQSYESTPSTDPSTGEYLDVSTGSYIEDIDFLTDKVIVYKHDGSVFCINNEPEDDEFSCRQLSRNSYGISSTHVDDTAYFIGRRGFFSFKPAVTYGDISPDEPGMKINPSLVNLSSYSLFPSLSRSQIYIVTPDSVYVYHYKPRENYGVFTRLSLPDIPVSIIDNNFEVLFVYRNYVTRLDENYNYWETLDEPVEVVGHVRSYVQIAQKHSILVMSRLLLTQNHTEGSLTLTLGKKKKTIQLHNPNVLVKDAHDPVNEPYEPVSEADVSLKDNAVDTLTRSYRVGGGSNRFVQAILEIHGIISLRGLSYEYLEV
jgi:hypothetical protein